MRAGFPSPRIIATSALDRLYQIDTPEALKECLNDYLITVQTAFILVQRKREDELIKSALGDKTVISSDLYKGYADNLRKAIDYVRDVPDDLAFGWHANIERFAAYKAFHATQEIREAKERYADDPELQLAVQQSIIRKYNRYQAAEEQTARHRARAGKQWSKFNESDRLRLFPNIQWLPSRSANPREEHIPFYNRIWPKNDPFWDHNQPGALWNCKCDWIETDKNSTDSTPDDTEPENVSPKGLEGNPGKTRELFTATPPDPGKVDKRHPYFASCSKTKSKTIDQWAVHNTFRPSATANLHKIQGGTVSVLLKDNPVDVLFDSKTTSHIANDIVNGGDFLMRELSSDLKGVLKGSELVAHEDNKKPEKKPSAVHYYYYKYICGDSVYYLSVEENYVVKENRHFFRLYAISDKLRDTAVMY